MAICQEAKIFVNEVPLYRLGDSTLIIADVRSWDTIVKTGPAKAVRTAALIFDIRADTDEDEMLRHLKFTFEQDMTHATKIECVILTGEQEFHLLRGHVRIRYRTALKAHFFLWFSDCEIS